MVTDPRNRILFVRYTNSERFHCPTIHKQKTRAPFSLSRSIMYAGTHLESEVAASFFTFPYNNNRTVSTLHGGHITMKNSKPERVGHMPHIILYNRIFKRTNKVHAARPRAKTCYIIKLELERSNKASGNFFFFYVTSFVT